MKAKQWLVVATLGALVLLALLAWRDILDAFYRLGELNIWVLLGMVPLLFCFYWALAQFFTLFLRAVGAGLPARTVFTAMLELNFVNHIFPSGGLSGFSYLTLRFKRFGVSTAKTTLAQISRFGFGFIFQILLMFVALFLLAIEDKVSSLIVLLVSILACSLFTAAAAGVFVASSPRRAVGFAHLLARWLNRAIHVVRRRHPETISLAKIEQTCLELHADYRLVRHDFASMRPAIGWIWLATALEIALLYVVFVAHGAWVNPGAVVIAFVVANTAGLVVALPGGIGVFEALMTTAFIAMGVPPVLALSATLVYRVIILLLSLLTGGVLYHRAISKLGVPHAGLDSQRTH